MNILTKYTRRCLGRNRVRTLVTVVGIILSVALFTAVAEGAYSGQQYLTDVIRTESGSYHALYNNVSDAELAELRSLPEIDRLAALDYVGWARVSDSSVFPFFRIASLGEGVTELLPLRLLQGRMPENEHELLISDRAAPSTGAELSVGQTLTLSVGRRVTPDGAELNDFNPYMDGEETLADAVETRYTIVGMYDRFPNAVESYGMPGTLVLTVGAAGTEHTALFTLKDIDKTFGFLQLHDYGLSSEVNRDLLLISGASGNLELVRVLYGLAAVLFVLIFFGSVALIYNSFSISVAERTRQFGLLKSIGATNRQVRRSVLLEAGMLCLTAIPLGLLLGCGGIGLTLRFLRPAFSRIITIEGAETVPIRLALNAPALLLAAGIGLFTALISAWIPARRAVRLSPIAAIRQSADVKIKPRAVRISPLTGKLFGFPAVLASKNFKRSRKQYRSTVLSLFMSIVLFISAMSFADALRNNVSRNVSKFRADLIVSSKWGEEPEEPDAVYRRLAGTEGITDASMGSGADLSLQMDAALLSEETKEMLAVSEGPCSLVLSVIALGDRDYGALCVEAGVEPGAADALLYGRVNRNTEEKRAVFDLLRSGVSAFDAELQWERTAMQGYYLEQTVTDEEGRVLSYVYCSEETDGSGAPLDRVEISAEAAERRAPVHIAGLLEEKPLASPQSGCVLYLSQSTAQRLFAGTLELDTTFFFCAENHIEGKASLERELRAMGLADQLEVWDTRAEREGIEAILLVLDVFTFGFIILISLIAAANVFNTISTNMGLRRREFATLKSVGMGERAFGRMTRYECLLYGGKALLFGLPVSLGMSLLIHRIVGRAFVAGSYRVPWAAMGVAAGSVFLVVFATMLYAAQKIKKDNPIDALKQETL